MNYHILNAKSSGNDFSVFGVVLEEEIYDIIADGISFDAQMDEIEVSGKNWSGQKNDFIVYASYFPIVSDQVKKILQSMETDKKYIEFIKIKFNKNKIKAPYWFMNLLNNIDAIDRSLSEFTVWPDFMKAKAGKIDTIKKAVLDQDKIGNRNIFRLMEKEVSIIISDKLIDILHENELTGFEIWSLDKLV